jgi:hypothetical protein
MFFTIEPMINLGKPWAKVLGDGWTAVTRDKSLSALSHELIARYGNDGTVIDLDQVQVSCHSLVADPRGCARGGTLCAPCAACASHLRRCPSAWASPRRPASW